MPAKDKLKIIEREYGESCDTLIPRLLEELRTPYRVAVHLGVYPNTIRHWLQKNGYKLANGLWKKVAK